MKKHAFTPGQLLVSASFLFGAIRPFIVILYKTVYTEPKTAPYDGSKLSNTGQFFELLALVEKLCLLNHSRIFMILIFLVCHRIPNPQEFYSVTSSGCCANGCCVLLFAEYFFVEAI